MAGLGTGLYLEVFLETQNKRNNKPAFSWNELNLIKFVSRRTQEQVIELVTRAFFK